MADGTTNCAYNDNSSKKNSTSRNTCHTEKINTNSSNCNQGGT